MDISIQNPCTSRSGSPLRVSLGSAGPYRPDRVDGGESGNDPLKGVQYRQEMGHHQMLTVEQWSSNTGQPGSHSGDEPAPTLRPIA